MLRTVILLSAFMPMLLLAQTDTTIYSSQQRVETLEYILSVPDKWKHINNIDMSSKDQKFDFTGVSLPAQYNNTPLSASFNMRKYPCDTLRAAEEYIVSEITSYPDRITPAGYNYERDTMNILSGEKAVLFTTHFYRRSKISNFSRYDMIVYSKKRKAAYMLTATFQYRDSTYAIEKSQKFREYVSRVFSTLLLR